LNPTHRVEFEPPASDVVEPLWRRVLNERFTILEPIGMGGMGKVYKAIQNPLDRIVAVKILNSNGGFDPEFRRRFYLEASLTSKLRHPNTVTVIDYGETPDGIFFLAMEYLNGEPLSQILARSGPLPWKSCIQIGQQICRSLREAHKLGIVHRDLKPANVMLMSDDGDRDLVKVLDFGLVKSFSRDGNELDTEATNPGIYVGSPQYMAPEQLRNQADPRSDIYSLGIVLYQMLAGRPPFVGKDAIDLILKHRNEAPPALHAVRPGVELPRELEALVMKCLEKQPNWRFQTMDDVLEALRKAVLAGGFNSSLTGPSRSARSGRFVNASAALKPPEKTAAFEIDVAAHAKRLSLFLQNQRLRSFAIFLGSLLTGLSLTSAILLIHRTGPKQVEVSPPAHRVVSPPAPSSVVQPEPSPPIKPKRPARSESTRPVTFRISSEPEGASVSINGRDLGTTPVTFDVMAGDSGEASAEVLFSLKGYQPLSVIMGGSGPEVVLTQRLQPSLPQRPVPSEHRRRDPSRETISEPRVAPEQPARRKTESEDAPKVVASVQPAAVEAAPENKPVAQQPAALTFASGMTRPEQISGNPIIYPREAIAARIEGVVTAKCVINMEGKVQNCQLLKSLPFMDNAVLNSLSSRLYKPATFEGRPVSVEYVFTIRLIPPRR